MKPKDRSGVAGSAERTKGAGDASPHLTQALNTAQPGSMQGRRLPDDSDIREAVGGDYFRVTWADSRENEWWFRDPYGDVGRITTHRVEEHEDGTITVSPSIAPAPGEDTHGWHGYLRRGVWESV